MKSEATLTVAKLALVGTIAAALIAATATITAALVQRGNGAAAQSAPRHDLAHCRPAAVAISRIAPAFGVTVTVRGGQQGTGCDHQCHL